MKFNISRQTETSIQPETFLESMEKEINNNPSCNFSVPFLFGRYRFRRKRGCRFSLTPAYWQRGFWIQGNIERKDDRSVIQYKMMPPLWFDILFIFGPFLIFVQMPLISKEILALVIFWGTCATGGMLWSLKYAKKIMEEIDKVIEDLKNQ
jgi:hypothetical protein